MGNEPKYRRVADDLRSAIARGDYPPGTALPTEDELIELTGVSRVTVRAALRELGTEGLIVTRRGAGSVVRRLPTLRRRIVGDLYGERPTGSPFAVAARAGGSEPSWEHETTKVAASAEIAERLGIHRGDRVVRTAYRFLADGEPVQTSISWEPLALTRGTPIELPEGGEVVGVVARMASIGIRMTSVTEDVQTRRPTPAEAAALSLPRGVPVFEIRRTYRAGDLPVETADIVVAGDRYTLTYNVTIPD